DALQAVAGETVADGADDRHGAANRRLEAQLASLPRRQPEQRRPVARDDLLVRGDDRLSCEERRADPGGRRVQSADRFDDDVDIAGEDRVDVDGPGDTRLGREAAAFLGRTAVANVRQREAGHLVAAGKPARDGRTDRAESDDRDATVWRGGNDVIGRIEAQRSLISPKPDL